MARPVPKIDVTVKVTRRFRLAMFIATTVGRLGAVGLAFWIARRAPMFLKVTVH